MSNSIETNEQSEIFLGKLRVFLKKDLQGSESEIMKYIGRKGDSFFEKIEETKETRELWEGRLSKIAMAQASIALIIEQSSSYVFQNPNSILDQAATFINTHSDPVTSTMLFASTAIIFMATNVMSAISDLKNTSKLDDNIEQVVENLKKINNFESAEIGVNKTSFLDYNKSEYSVIIDDIEKNISRLSSLKDNGNDDYNFIMKVENKIAKLSTLKNKYIAKNQEITDAKNNIRKILEDNGIQEREGDIDNWDKMLSGKKELPERLNTLIDEEIKNTIGITDKEIRWMKFHQTADIINKNTILSTIASLGTSAILNTKMRENGFKLLTTLKRTHLSELNKDKDYVLSDKIQLSLRETVPTFLKVPDNILYFTDETVKGIGRGTNIVKQSIIETSNNIKDNVNEKLDDISIKVNNSLESIKNILTTDVSNLFIRREEELSRELESTNVRSNSNTNIFSNNR